MMRTIEELKTTKAEKFIQGLELAEFIEITKSIDLDRLSEICTAEREGRLVVLPCKIGQKLYDFGEYFDVVQSPEFHEIDSREITISRDEQENLMFTIDCCDYSKSDFGSIVFKSMEQAEKALAERNKNE